jgi:hypothetical protein
MPYPACPADLVLPASSHLRPGATPPVTLPGSAHPPHPLQDYRLALSGALTEQQLLEQRVAEYEAAEAERLALLEEEEARIMVGIQKRAAAAAEVARKAYK